MLSNFEKTTLSDDNLVFIQQLPRNNASLVFLELMLSYQPLRLLFVRRFSTCACTWTRYFAAEWLRYKKHPLSRWFKVDCASVLVELLSQPQSVTVEMMWRWYNKQTLESGSTDERAEKPCVQRISRFHYSSEFFEWLILNFDSSLWWITLWNHECLHNTDGLPRIIKIIKTLKICHGKNDVVHMHLNEFKSPV